MGQDSKIEWTDHTFNPWIGCTRVSPGCQHCYAETLMDARYGKVKWGKGQPRQRTSAANWKKPLQWNAAQGRHQDFMEGSADRPRVFCASLSDWLDNEVPIEWLADLLALIHATPNLDWLMLSKRPENWRARMEAASDFHFDQGDRNVCGWLVDWWKRGVAPDNVWIGTTVEDQKRADERILQLLSIPAKVRFLSCEPLLGPVDLQKHLRLRVNSYGVLIGPKLNIDTGSFAYSSNDGTPVINWVIAGGESGPGARPMHPDWAESLRNQCQTAGVAFFFKQWGEWAGPGHEQWGRLPKRKLCWIDSDGKRLDPPPQDENADCVTMKRVGKHAAGRELFGRTWDEFPTTNHTPANS